MYVYIYIYIHVYTTDAKKCESIAECVPEELRFGWLEDCLEGRGTSVGFWGRGLSKLVISTVIIRVTPFRALISLLITYLLCRVLGHLQRRLTGLGVLINICFFLLGRL